MKLFEWLFRKKEEVKKEAKVNLMMWDKDDVNRLRKIAEEQNKKTYANLGLSSKSQQEEVERRRRDTEITIAEALFFTHLQSTDSSSKGFSEGFGGGSYSGGGSSGSWGDSSSYDSGSSDCGSSSD